MIIEVKVTKPEGSDPKIMLNDELGVILKYPAWNEFIGGSVMGKTPTADGIVEIVAGCIDQIFDKEDVYDSSTTTKKEFIQFIEFIELSIYRCIVLWIYRFMDLVI